MGTEVVVALIAGAPLLVTAIAAALMKFRKVERQRDNAQTQLIDQQAAHEKADTESTMVTAIKEVLEEVREHSKSKDAELNTLRADMRQVRAESTAEVREVWNQFQQFEHRVRVLLAAHGSWDTLILAEVRKSNPDFPDPPPLGDLEPRN